MADDKEFEQLFWKALKSDMTMMLGLDGVEDGHTRPMTAQVEGESGPIWFFTSSENDLVSETSESSRAIATFVSKGHDLFATVHGSLRLDTDREAVDRLWNPFVAAWFEGGKDDPNLQLLRFEPDAAHVWLNDNSVFAGVRLLLGRDPRKDYADKAGEIRLRG